jgi:hypothetical protein
MPGTELLSPLWEMGLGLALVALVMRWAERRCFTHAPEGEPIPFGLDWLCCEQEDVAGLLAERAGHRFACVLARGRRLARIPYRQSPRASRASICSSQSG